MTAVGDRAPAFTLPDTEGIMHEPGGAPATVVVFTCNHCPYALAWHDRIVGVARDYADRGVRVLAVNPNDAENYPRDSLQAMRARVGRGEFEGIPYMCDESQNVARAYGAKTTPDVFVLDATGVLRYRGARTPTTTTPYRTPRSCAAPSMRCSTVATPIRSRRHRSVALSSGGPEVAGPKQGARSARLGQRSRARGASSRVSQRDKPHSRWAPGTGRAAPLSAA